MFEDDYDPKTAESVAEAARCWSCVDDETVEILMDDYIATGG